MQALFEKLGYKQFGELKSADKGSFGKIFKAFHHLEECWFIIKVLQFSQSNIIKEQAINEAKLLIKLKNFKHDNIVRQKDSIQTSDQLILIMEACEKGSLRKLLNESVQKGKFPIEESIITRQLKMILKGIEQLHLLNIIHRDIKLENLFLTDLDIIKIGDFGIARELKPGELANTNCGSQNQMAPEIYNGHYNEKVDIWAVGICMLKLMVSNELAIKDFFNYKNFLQIKNAIGSKQSKKLIDLVEKMLLIDYTKRASAKELLENEYWPENQETIPQPQKEKNIKKEESKETIKNGQPELPVLSLEKQRSLERQFPNYKPIQNQPIVFPDLPQKIKNVQDKLESFIWPGPGGKNKEFLLNCETHKIGNSFYWGELHNGKQDGRGIEVQITETKCFQYEGNFTDGKKNGEGRLISEEGEQFEGKFYDNLPCQGIFVGANSVVFKGQFEGFGNKQLNGAGSQQAPDGTKQEGCFNKGIEHGKGKIFNADGSTIDGDFENGKLKQGTYRWPDGKWQLGQFLNDKFDGKGTYHFENGEQYTGEYKNGEKHGQGFVVKADGTIISGNWEYGKLNGMASLIKESEITVKMIN